ncbi:MAG: 2-hydroxyacid dehydrogenase [Paracoccus sp.]|nr:2-hydroxyacid dehydrogenase [Paracoccus sp. (in: a-proteobacteria)]
MTPELVQISPLRAIVSERLSEKFVIHRLWEAEDPDALLAQIGPRVRGLLAGGTRIDGAFMDRLPALEIIAAFGVGYDQIDAEAAAGRGVVVTHTPDVLSDEVADITIALLIGTIRRLPQAQDYLRAGKWAEQGAFPLTASLRGRKVGIFGLGRIGKAIWKRLDAMGLEVAYCGRNRQDLPLNYFDDITELARACDVLILAAPGTEETQGIVDEDVLDALGRDGFLINIGRGALVNEADLAAALAQGRIAGAGLDVFADEPHPLPALLEAPNTMLLPHVASASDHTRDAMGQLVVDNVTSWFERGRPVTPVPESRSLLTE